LVLQSFAEGYYAVNPLASRFDSGFARISLSTRIVGADLER